MVKPTLMPHSTKDGKKASGCWWAVYPSGSAGSSFILKPISLRVLRPTATGHIRGLGTSRGVERTLWKLKEHVPLELEAWSFWQPFDYGGRRPA